MVTSGSITQKSPISTPAPMTAPSAMRAVEATRADGSTAMTLLKPSVVEQYRQPHGRLGQLQLGAGARVAQILLIKLLDFALRKRAVGHPNGGQVGVPNPVANAATRPFARSLRRN